jgi:hypothetical protein
MPERVDNGLLAASYVPLTDIDTDVGRQLLTVLGRARIAAYLDPVATRVGERRLFVAADERGDARTIVSAAISALNGPTPADEAETDAAGDTKQDPPADPLAGIDTDAAFAELIADWHVDTVAAVREAERQLRREDADWGLHFQQPQIEDPVWLDDDHYVPPSPPPLPRLAAPTILAIVIMVASILMLALGGKLGFSPDFTLLSGVCGLLAGACVLVMRLRDRRDDDDDGAVL